MKRVRFHILAIVAGGILLGASSPHTTAEWEFLGVALGAPVDESVLDVRQCWTGREFAFLSGSYRITTDDLLLSVPHEHNDSSAVLFALDSVEVCSARARHDNFGVFLTLIDQRAVEIQFVWVDPDYRPTMDSLVKAGAAAFGPFFETNEYDVTIWDDDDVKVWMSERNPLSEGPSVVLSDRGACEWFEDLIHTKTARRQWVEDDTKYC